MARLIRISSCGQEITHPDFSGMANAIVAPPVVELADRATTLTASDDALPDGQPAAPEPIALRRARAQARTEERRRVRRLLHDEIGQSLTALAVKLAVLRGHASGAMQNQLRDMHKLLEKTLSQVQTLSKDLHPSAVEDLGLVPALRSHIKRISQDGSIAVQLKASEPSVSAIDPALALAVYRCAEALLADMREASVSKATLSLAVEGGFLRLEARLQTDLVPDVQSFQEQVLIGGGAVQCRASRHQAIITAQFPMTNHGHI